MINEIKQMSPNQSTAALHTLGKSCLKKRRADHVEDAKVEEESVQNVTHTEIVKRCFVVNGFSLVLRTDLLLYVCAICIVQIASWIIDCFKQL